MSWDGENGGWPMDEPIGWVVIRRRGGWNAEPEVVAFYHQEWRAQFEALTPELSGCEPPADCTIYSRTTPSCRRGGPSRYRRR